jgi:hypothetical protein
MQLQTLDAQGNPAPFDDAFPPFNQTIALTLDPTTNTYVSEPLMMTPDLQVLPSTPSLPFKAVRLGMCVNATSASIASMPQHAPPAMNPSSDPSIPQAGHHPFDYLAQSNGKINMIASSSTDVHVNLNVAPPMGAPGPFTLTCTQVGGDAGAAGSFTGSDANGNILTGPSITIPAATATSLSYRFNPPSSILQTTLTFTWNGTGLAPGDASARIPVQIWADAGTARITSQYVLSSGEVFANSGQHKGFRMQRASDVTRRILAQAGITAVDTAVATASYPVFQVAPTGTVPSNVLNYNGQQDAAAWLEGTSLQNQTNLFASNLTLTYVDSIPLSQTPGLTLRTGPDARRYALVTKATWSDVFGIATPCHEMGHMLGLVDATMSQVDNLMMNHPDSRVMNALSNGVPSLAGGSQDQITVIRQQAAIVNQP